VVRHLVNDNSNVLISRYFLLNYFNYGLSYYLQYWEFVLAGPRSRLDEACYAGLVRSKEAWKSYNMKGIVCLWIVKQYKITTWHCEAPVFILFALFWAWLVVGLRLRCENHTDYVFSCICRCDYHLSQCVILSIGICEFLWWCVCGHGCAYYILWRCLYH